MWTIHYLQDAPLGVTAEAAAENFLDGVYDHLIMETAITAPTAEAVWPAWAEYKKANGLPDCWLVCPIQLS